MLGYYNPTNSLMCDLCLFNVFIFLFSFTLALNSKCRCMLILLYVHAVTLSLYCVKNFSAAAFLFPHPPSQWTKWDVKFWIALMSHLVITDHTYCTVCSADFSWLFLRQTLRRDLFWGCMCVSVILLEVIDLRKQCSDDLCISWKSSLPYWRSSSNSVTPWIGSIK